MRRALTFIAAMLVMLSSSACTEQTEENAFDLYEKSITAILDADSVQAVVKVKTISEAGGISEETNSETSVKMIMQGGSVQAEVKAPGTAYGVSGDVALYLKDNQMYINIQGQKIKRAMSEKDQKSLISTSQPAKFSASDVKEQKTENSGGKKKLTMTVKGDAMTETFRESLGEQFAQSQLSINDVSIEAIVGESGYLETVRLQYVITLSYAGQEMKMEMDVTSEYVQVGNVKIDFPSDLDTYRTY